MKKSAAMPSLILILASIVLPGCSKTAETVKPAANKTPTILNNNSAPATVSSPVSATPNAAGTTPTSAEANKIPAPAVKNPTPQTTTGADDFVLFTQVRGALSADSELTNAVIVEMKEGNVVLTGNVSSEAQKTKAGQIAQGVKGVKSVKNNLLVAR